ncbi:unnamed protein product [Paramecium pentaurelia]|uniref:Uncharacterized protein n=1 Tax=Paramecium pentaurelia TaxID=43138 RepID=A0A8S1W4T9_9CILI|nr:unnamed protein product [Paramecium pentaurelia]
MENIQLYQSSKKEEVYSTVQIEYMIVDFINNSSSNFVEQIPNYIKYSICDILQQGLKSAAKLCGNSKSIKEIFRKSTINQQLCLEERHSQISTQMKGTDEMELVDAESE